MPGEEIAIGVRLFAALREALGGDRLTLRVPDGATVEGLLDRLVAEHPALETYRPHLQVAVNRTIVGGGAALHDGDEVALLPPVGGG